MIDAGSLKTIKSSDDSHYGFIRFWASNKRMAAWLGHFHTGFLDVGDVVLVVESVKTEHISKVLTRNGLVWVHTRNLG